MFADIKIQLYINITDILKSKHKVATVKGDNIYFNSNIMNVSEKRNIITISLTNTPSGIVVKQDTTWFELERSLDSIVDSLLIDLDKYIDTLRSNTLTGIRESILGIYSIPERDIENIDDYTIKFPIQDNFTMTYVVNEEFVRSSVSTKDLNGLNIDTPIGKFVPKYLVEYIVKTMQEFYYNTR